MSETFEHTGYTEFDRKQTVHTNQQAARISALEVEAESLRNRVVAEQQAKEAIANQLSTLRARCERAEAVVRAATAYHCVAVVSGGKGDGVSCVDAEEYARRFGVLKQLLAARVEELEPKSPTELLAAAEAKHSGMFCDVTNMLFQAGCSNRGYQASLNQLADHLCELTTRWLAGDEMAMAEFVTLYRLVDRAR